MISLYTYICTYVLCVVYNTVGSDYTPDSFTFEFSTGDVRSCHNLSILMDGEGETAERFDLTLLSGDPGVQLGLNRATVTIAGDESEPFNITYIIG